MLAAFALWADTNIAVEPLRDASRERTAAICSRIRFPEVPPDVLLNYWTAFSWLQQYDSGKELVLRAVRSQKGNCGCVHACALPDVPQLTLRWIAAIHPCSLRRQLIQHSGRSGSSA